MAGMTELWHQKGELEDRDLEDNVVIGINGQHWKKNGEMGREGGMKRWVVVSHCSSGRIRPNGSLYPSDTHKHMTHMKIC